MANGSTSKKTDFKAWMQELKTNRQTQAALLGFVAVLTWLLWPEPPKKVRRAGGDVAGGGAAGLDARQVAALKKLPKLAELDKARQLPDEDKVQRDLFLFDGQQWTPPPPPPPKPKPPTAAELAAQEVARLAAIEKAKKDEDFAQRPSSLRYLGFIESPTAGLIGGFLKGEIPEQHRPGALVGKGWKLVKLTEKAAEFQSLKYSDMRFTIEAKDSSGSTRENAVSNEF